MRAVLVVSYSSPITRPLIPLFKQERKRSENEDRHRPQANGILIGTDRCEILSDERETAKHPVEDAIGIGPDPSRVINVFTEMTVGVECREPVSSRFIDENRMDVLPHFVEKAET